MEHPFALHSHGFNPLVGTASWSEKTLLDCGKFYPPTAKTPEARLRFYASQFNLVEVDTSYYAIPAVATAQHWAERTPPGFVFNVKAFSLFTGQWTSTDVLPKDIKEALGPGWRMIYKDMGVEVLEELWKRFVACLVPLQVNGKLGLVHFQFPPKVVRHPVAMAHIEHCVEHLPGHTLSIEFRHPSWWENDAVTADTLDGCQCTKIYLRRITAFGLSSGATFRGTEGLPAQPLAPV